MVKLFKNNNSSIFLKTSFLSFLLQNVDVYTKKTGFSYDKELFFQCTLLANVVSYERNADYRSGFKFCTIETGEGICNMQFDIDKTFDVQESIRT